ncbi:hypothetical protein BDV93DRAFT_509481 [Ceratobasidium sp. AG-I]|nr:hypothetical protein BDV93DRAFT_509481 [Ceratobasidium sp. AG-I]
MGARFLRHAATPTAHVLSPRNAPLMEAIFFRHPRSLPLFLQSLKTWTTVNARALWDSHSAFGLTEYRFIERIRSTRSCERALSAALNRHLWVDREALREIHLDHVRAPPAPSAMFSLLRYGFSPARSNSPYGSHGSIMTSRSTPTLDSSSDLGSDPSVLPGLDDVSQFTRTPAPSLVGQAGMPPPAAAPPRQASPKPNPVVIDLTTSSKDKPKEQLKDLSKGESKDQSITAPTLAATCNSTRSQSPGSRHRNATAFSTSARIAACSLIDMICPAR